LIAKWKEKRNTNLEMIIAKKNNEQPKITVVTRGGMRNRGDVIDKRNRIHQWVKKVVEPYPMFYPQKSKETYHQVRKEFVG
jgi:hypothetical protein